MTRKRASRDKIEEMLLEKIRAHPGCEKANHVSIYLVEGCAFRKPHPLDSQQRRESDHDRN